MEGVGGRGEEGEGGERRGEEEGTDSEVSPTRIIIACHCTIQYKTDYELKLHACSRSSPSKEHSALLTFLRTLN